MNTSTSELFGAALLDREAYALVCAKGSRIEWFYDQLDGADA